MSNAASAQAYPQYPQGPLGVMDAVGMGWRLLMQDFWMLWLLAIVLGAVMAGVGLVSCCLLCLAPVVAFFVEPPLEAGMFKAIKRRVDGGAVNFSDLFAAFPECYWQAVVAGLPAMAIDGVGQMIQLPVRLVGQFAEPIRRELHWPEETLIIAAIILAIVLFVLIVALVILRLFFSFTLLAIWDRKEAGVEAIKTSMRLVKDHFWSILGLSLLFVLIGIAAAILGTLACLVGLFITIPAVAVWYKIVLVYLYRSWTGQPLEQPMAGGPVLPTPGRPSALV